MLDFNIAKISFPYTEQIPKICRNHFGCPSNFLLPIICSCHWNFSVLYKVSIYIISNTHWNDSIKRWTWKMHKKKICNLASDRAKMCKSQKNEKSHWIEVNWNKMKNVNWQNVYFYLFFLHPYAITHVGVWVFTSVFTCLLLYNIHSTDTICQSHKNFSTIHARIVSLIVNMCQLEALKQCQ